MVLLKSLKQFELTIWSHVSVGVEHLSALNVADIFFQFSSTLFGLVVFMLSISVDANVYKKNIGSSSIADQAGKWRQIKRTQPKRVEADLRT